MQRLTFVTILLTGALLAASAFAEEAEAPKPPWLQTDVLKAALEIGMTEEQRPQFQQAVTNLVNNQLSATNRLLRGNNVSNLERRLKSSTNRQFKKMDKEMAAFLDEGQMERYAVYRDAMRNAMAEWARTRGRSTNASFNNASAALNGGTGNSSQ